PGHGFVEAHEDVASFHPVAVAGAHFADDTAGRVLHLFHIGIDDERTLRNERAGDFGGGGPAAAADRQESNAGRAANNMTADGCASIATGIVTHAEPPSPGTTFKVRGAACGCATRVRTSSLGPNCC